MEPRFAHRLSDFVFYLGLGALFSHELDAIPNHEWRGMVLLRALPDETALPLFVALHVPLFAVLIALVASTHPRIRGLSRLAIAAFLLVHGLLHAASMGQPGFEFASSLSQLLIFGGAGLGLVYLALEARQRLERARR